jgi:hypothetical protein
MFHITRNTAIAGERHGSRKDQCCNGSNGGGSEMDPRGCKFRVERSIVDVATPITFACARIGFGAD